MRDGTRLRLTLEAGNRTLMEFIIRPDATGLGSCELGQVQIVKTKPTLVWTKCTDEHAAIATAMERIREDG